MILLVHLCDQQQIGRNGDKCENSSKNISSKMANDLIEMEKSSVSRIVGLETAVSKYHEQILENNNNIRDIQPKLQNIRDSMDSIETNVSSNLAF